MPWNRSLLIYLIFFSSCSAFTSVFTHKSCGLPEFIINGNYQLLNDTTLYLSQVYYTCHEGYQMVGHPRRFCQINQVWSGRPPQCQYIMCSTSRDCQMILGASCFNSQCLCEMHGTTRFYPPCIYAIANYGESCRFDSDCNSKDSNLECAKNEQKICKCRRGMVWDIVSKRCYNVQSGDVHPNIIRFDSTGDIIIPTIVLMTLCFTGWLCLKLYCNNWKAWSRRRRPPIPRRSLEEPPIPRGPVPHSTTAWVASYRDTRNVPPPCLHLPTGPPPYEEALKHKVVLSSIIPGPSTSYGPLTSRPLTSSAPSTSIAPQIENEESNC